MAADDTLATGIAKNEGLTGLRGQGCWITQHGRSWVQLGLSDAQNSPVLLFVSKTRRPAGASLRKQNEPKMTLEVHRRKLPLVMNERNCRHSMAGWLGGPELMLRFAYTVR